jgi:alkanesulfonate monooxygenase SsuD/methylene tetrahydromethanopterin reductase-like flavin-dependent oxidoreductase (luciferase family)
MSTSSGFDARNASLRRIGDGVNVKVGSLVPFQIAGGVLSRLREVLASMADAGLDHAVIGDHVSFHGGFGVDGLVAATAMVSAEPRLAACTSVYQLPLRHPVIVARQLSTISGLAPGKLIFGVGLGGDDRHELEVSGVDPRTRGRRMDECLEVITALLTGEPLTYQGEFFQLDEAIIRPAPPEPVTILVGGRADAAFRRAARWGHGYLGLWISAARFARATATVADLSAEFGRSGLEWQHGMTVWCGFGPDEPAARAALAKSMERLYRQPFENFEKYSPYGSPERVAEFLAAYCDAGCTTFNLLTRAPSAAEGIEAAAEVQQLLRKHVGAGGASVVVR